MPMAPRPQSCGVVGIAVHADFTSDRMSPTIGVGAEGFTGSCKDYKSMKVQTTRFGTVEVDDNRVLNFPSGLLGFSSYTQYALLQPDNDGLFFWLQSTEAPELAFVVTDPATWVPDYQATIRKEQMEDLELPNIENAQTFAIVNKYDQTLTINLQGPIVVNLANHLAMQLVLADKRWTTRHEIVKLTSQERLTA